MNDVPILEDTQIARGATALVTIPTEEVETWILDNKSLVDANENVSLDLGEMPSGSRGANYIHGYKNYGTPNCGQAAVATIWDYWRFDPGYAGPRTVSDPSLSERQYWQDYQVVEQITRNFPNDIVGASPNRLCDAFRAAGFENGWSWGPNTTYETIAPFINNSIPVPVICLVQWGAALHWVCVYRLSDGHVWFSNPAQSSIGNYNDPAELSREQWRCARMPYDKFGEIWSWTGLTKCHIVAFRR